MVGHSRRVVCSWHRESQRPLGSALGFLMTLGKTLQSCHSLKCLVQLLCPDWNKPISNSASHKGSRHHLNLLDAPIEQIRSISRDRSGLYTSGHDPDAPGKIPTEIPGSKLILFRGPALQLCWVQHHFHNHFSCRASSPPLPKFR